MLVSRLVSVDTCTTLPPHPLSLSGLHAYKEVCPGGVLTGGVDTSVVGEASSCREEGRRS